MIIFIYFVQVIYLSKCIVANAVPDEKNVADTCLLNNNARFIKAIEDAKQTSDPIPVELFDFTNSIDLKYQLKDAELTGLKNCNITKLSINRDDSRFQYNLECQRLQANSNYNLHGHLDDISVEGDGFVTITSGHYILKFHGFLEKIEDEKIGYAHIKDHSLNYEPKEPVKIDFKNLFGGDKEKSEALLKYISDNWGRVEEKLRLTILAGFLDVYIKNLNNVLKAIPIDQILPGSC